MGQGAGTGWTAEVIRSNPIARRLAALFRDTSTDFRTFPEYAKIIQDICRVPPDVHIKDSIPNPLLDYFDK